MKVSKNINVKKILDKLQKFYSERGINLVCLSNKWSFRTAQNLSKLMSQQKTIEKKLSKAAIELNWVRPQGRKEVPGRPIQYATTEVFLSHFNLQKLTDLPTVDELGSAGLIDTGAIDASVFGTGKFYQEKQDEKKENIYSNIDEMLTSTLKDKESD